MRAFLLLTSLLPALFFSGCQKKSDLEFQRAHDPWVFRSVLDGRPRMLTAALNDDLWVAYSAQTGALYKAWRGSVNFDGAVYTTVHGPQPSSLGDDWFVNQFDNPWSVIRNGTAEKPEVDYKGHRFIKGQVHINTELKLKDGARIRVSERPEYVSNDNNQTGLERSFSVEGLPEGAQLVLDVNVSSIAFENLVRTDGQLAALKRTPRQAKGLSGIDLEGKLTLNSNGTTHLTTFFTRLPLIENANKVVGAEEEETRPLGYRLIQRNDCKTCHNTYVQTVGPSYVDIAKRYRNTEQNVEMLTLKVKNGGAGSWGETVMNAHHEVPDEDIKAMVDLHHEP
jgi:cytochrome c